MVSVHCLLKGTFPRGTHNLQRSALQVREPPTPTAAPRENGCHADERWRDFGKTGRKCDEVNRDVITPKSLH